MEALRDTIFFYMNIAYLLKQWSTEHYVSLNEKSKLCLNWNKNLFDCCDISEDTKASARSMYRDINWKVQYGVYIVRLLNCN